MLRGEFYGVSFSGRMGSGKNHCAEMLVRGAGHLHVHELSFGAYVKAFATFLLNAPCFTEEQKNAPIPPGVHYDVAAAVCEMFFGKDPIGKAHKVDGGAEHMTTTDYPRNDSMVVVSDTPVCTIPELIEIVKRGLAEHAPATRGHLLQVLGTEIIRKKVHADFWMELLRREIVSLNKCARRWVITDARFPNEVKMIEENGGVCVYVSSTVPYTGTRDPNHESERALDGMRMRTLVNNRTAQTNEKLDWIFSGNWVLICCRLGDLQLREIGSNI